MDSSLYVDGKQMVGGDLDLRITGADWTLHSITPQSISGETGGPVLIGGVVARQGFLDADGIATIPDIPATPKDSALQFGLPDLGVSWQFRMKGDGATHSLRDLVDEFGPPNPIGPVPGPRGIYAVAVYLDQDDSEAAPATPTGGEIVTGTGHTTAPTGWLLRPGALADGKARWASSVTVVDGVDPPVVTDPAWSAPIEVGDAGGGPTPGPSTTHTALPVIGDGEAASPVTIGEGKILGKHVAEGTLPASKLAVALGAPLYVGTTEPAGAVDGAVWVKTTANTKRVGVWERTGGTFVEIASGSVVAANPTGAATGGAATHLEVEGVIYSIAEGHITAVKTKLPVTGDGTDDDPVTFDATQFVTPAALAAEAKSRADGDTTLGGFITDEAADRASADTALGGRITGETTARKAGDDTLDGKITTETSAREAADTALGKRVDDEASARSTEDGKLAGRIDAANVKIAANKTKIDANTAKIPAPSDTAPGNTPGSPSAGTGTDYARHDHDHGITAGGASFDPTQAALYPGVKPILEAADASDTVEPVTFTDDDSAHVVKMGVQRIIISTDWGNLPDGFSFRVGHVVPRMSRFYIAKKANRKSGTGPDNDPDNWGPITPFAGAWKANWYDPGEVTFHADNLWQTAVAVVEDDPAPDDADNVKWQLITGGSLNASGGGGVGTYKELFSGSVNKTGTTFDFSDLVENEVLDLILRGDTAEAARSQFVLPAGFVDLASGNAVTSINVAASGANRLMQRSLVWTGSGTTATATAKSRDTADATVTAGIVRPEHATPFTPTPTNLWVAVDGLLEADDGITITPKSAQSKIGIGLDLTEDLAYAAVKGFPKAGNNVKITFDETNKHWVTDVRLPDEASPRVYALDSRDVRTVKPPYSYSITSEGWVLTPGQRTMEPGPVSTEGYSSDHPGFVRDTTNSSNNYNGRDFTLLNAGTLQRTFAMSSEITPANERQYSSDETITFRIFVGGYFKTKPTPDGQVIYTKTFHFTGGYQDAFHFDWELTLSQAGRAGEHDWWRCDYEWLTGSGEVVQGEIQAAKHTPSLPALGSIPKQAFGHVGAHDLDELAAWIPPELASQITAASRVATFSVTDPDNTGTNSPNESDKADVLLPTVDSNQPFLRAAQDLSRLKLHFEGAAQNGAGDVYLCGRIQGFPPSVLANTSAASAWAIDYTAQGVMALEDFYILDPTGGGMGSPTATWDANPGGPKINSVINGIFHTAHLVAGINFTPNVTSEISIDDDELTEAAEAGLLHVIRFFSGNAVAEIPLRGIPRPVPFGSGSSLRKAIGPGWVKRDAAAAAGNTTLIWVSPYRDIHGLHFSLHSSTGPTQQAYISGVEIEYAKYVQ